MPLKVVEYPQKNTVDRGDIARLWLDVLLAFFSLQWQVRGHNKMPLIRFVSGSSF